jgi:hypothetical protein
LKDFGFFKREFLKIRSINWLVTFHTSNSGGGLDAGMVFRWLVFSNQPKWFLMLELFHTGF